jgi:hypothetical protein
METPAFRLGLVGFDKHEEELLRPGVAQYRQVQWRCGPAHGADAWLINGARVARVQESRVRVIASEEALGATALMLDVHSRPTAVSGPTPQALQQLVGHSFEVRRPETLKRCLLDLDRGLAPLRRMYRIAALLIECNATVGKAVYELRAGPQLLAVADMKGSVFSSPDASEQQLRQASWRHRARKMVDVPADFEQHALSELLWAYTTRTRRNLLPDRYTDSRIYLRRPPRLRADLVEDIHLWIIRELASGAASFVELLGRLDTDEATLTRALAALYYVGSVTSNAERAWAASQQSALWSTRAALSEQGVEPSRSAHEGQPSTAPLL